MIGHPSMDMVYQFARPDVGIDELAISPMIYPNPTINTLTISGIPETSIGTTAYLIDVTGKIIQKIQIQSTNQHIKLTEHNQGIYFLRINQTTQQIILE